MTAAPAGYGEEVAQAEGRRHRAGWALALRGLVALIFGIIAVRYPSAAAGSFVIIFAVFAFADAILELITANAVGKMGMRWGWYVVAAIVSAAAGVIALLYPRITFVALVLLIGARAIVTGVLEAAAAISWRGIDGRFLLGATGVLSIVLGILLFASPASGGLALLWTIGVYAVVLGVMLIGLGIWVGTRGRTHHHAPAT
jgi:uncharacterized membrane protein HdeD (DUF308 family)